MGYGLYPECSQSRLTERTVGVPPDQILHMKKVSRHILVALLIAAAAGFTGWRVWQAYEKKNAASPAAKGPGKGGATRVISVGVARARTGAVRDDIEITGSLKPKEQVDVTSKVTGRVEQLTVQIGDLVRKGQLLAELEDSELAQQVRRAQAARDVVAATQQQRQAELANVKADADRAKQLFDQGLIARQDYDTKLTNFRVMQAQIALVAAQAEQAAAELHELTIQRSQMKIYAPISGYIAQRFVDIGAVVSPSTPIVKVVNLSTMVTVANVPEVNISRLRIGGGAVVTVDALNRQEFPARVARIAPVLDVATRTALVEVEIRNPQGALKAEMFARVKLDVGGTRDAVLVPRESLVYKGQQPGVYVLESKRPVFRPVDTGTTHGPDVEVTANLAAGATVVSRGAAMIQDGDQIRVVEDVKDATAEPPSAPTSDREGAGPEKAGARVGA